MSEHRRGRLAQGLEGGPIENCHNAPMCGAKTRAGTPCRRPACRGRKRCHLHGGRSTGARTIEGLERCREAATVHGYYTARARAERQQVSQSMRRTRGVMAFLSGKMPSAMDLEAMDPADLALLMGMSR